VAFALAKGIFGKRMNNKREGTGLTQEVGQTEKKSGIQKKQGKV